jgi:hypothetical protein
MPPPVFSKELPNQTWNIHNTWSSNIAIAWQYYVEFDEFYLAQAIALLNVAQATFLSALVFLEKNIQTQYVKWSQKKRQYVVFKESHQMCNITTHVGLQGRLLVLTIG